MAKRPPPKSLDKASSLRAAQTLARRDPKLAQILRDLGPPPFWKRPATLATFVRIILEQQVSLAAGKTMFERFKTACSPKVTADAIIDLGEDHLRAIGFSRQKARYTLALANDVADKRFRIGSLRYLPDEEARIEITGRLGMGDWTADVFLMMALQRPDIFPVGDLALVNGLKQIDQGDYPTTDSLLQRAELWRPYRSVASRMIWQNYLHARNRTMP